MPIIADNSIPAEHPPEAYEKAEQMLAILYADRTEEDIAALVGNFDVGDMELQLHAWELLSVRERRAWREYYMRRPK